MRPRAGARVFAGIGISLVLAGPAAAGEGDAPPARFGQAGQLVLSVTRLVPLLAFTARKVDTSAPNDAPTGDALSLFSDPNGTNAYNVPRIGFDYVPIRGVTFGFDASGYTTFGSRPAIGELPSVTLLGVAPRVGYVAPLDRLVAVWLRGGVAYYAVTERGVSSGNGGTLSYSSRWSQLDADLEAHLIIAPAPHVAVSIGVVAEVPLHGEFEEQRGETQVSASASWLHVGLTAGLLGYL